MNKLTNEEIARVFAMYYNSEYQFGYATNNSGKGIGVVNFNFQFNEYEAGVNSKLLLIPLSAITDEHAINLAELVNDEKYEITETFKVIKEDERISVYSSKAEHSDTPLGSYRYETRIYTDCYTTRIKPYSETRQIPYEAYQYLIQQRYAVPLWFGIGHWANGKTAIELGIAESK